MLVHSDLTTELHKRILSRAILYADVENNQGTNTFRILSSQGKPQKWLIDLRKLAMCSADLDLLAQVFWDRMTPHFPFQVGGLEVGAVPLVSAILMKGHALGKSVNGFVVRKSRKKRGLCQQVEGEVNELPIVIVDDLVNSGQSVQRVLAVLQEQKHDINSVFSYINFGNPTSERFFKSVSIQHHHIFQLQDFNISATPQERHFPEEQTLNIQWQFSPTSHPNYTLSLPRSAPVFDGDNIYYGADDANFYAINKRTGVKQWSFETGESVKGILSSPVIFQGRVIFGAYDGSLYCLNCTSGKQVWQSHLAEYIGSSPCISESLGLVFIGLEHSIYQQRGEIAAVDLMTGEKRWGMTVSNFVHASPIYDADSNSVFIGSNHHIVYALDASSGECRWQFDAKGPVKMAAAVDSKRRQVIVPSFDGHCYGLDIVTGRENFRLKAGFAFNSTPLVFNDHLYIGSCDKHFYIYDLKQNQQRHKLASIGRIFSSPRQYNNSIWYGSNDGFIRQIDKDGKCIGGILLSERPLTPVVYDDELQHYLIVTMGNHLVCLK